MNELTPSTFIWNELASTDTAAAREFYTRVFGWTVDEESMPTGETYTVFKNDGVPVAGMMDVRDTTAPADTPSHWFGYLATRDAAATCRATRESGGVVLREPWSIPGVGTLAILAGPDGSAFGIMQPESNAGAA